VLESKLQFSVLARSLLNLVKPGHCAKLSSNMSLSVYMLNKQKKSLLSLENEFILSEFSRRTYMTILKQILNSDHQFRCVIFIAYSCVHQTNASTKLNRLQSYWILMKELTGKSQTNKLQIFKWSYCWLQKELIPISWHHVHKLLVYMAYDENSCRYRLNKFEFFAFFLLYTLAHPFYVKCIWPPSIVKQIIFHFLPLPEMKTWACHYYKA